MHKFTLSISSVLVMLLSSLSLNAQNVNIPDPNFKAYLLGETAINTNMDGEIQVSEAIAYTGDLDCEDYNIADFTGIEAFVNVPKAYLDGNLETSLDVTGMTTLWKLVCDDSDSLSSITFGSNPNLSWVQLNYCNFSSLDVSSLPVLQILHLVGNSLTTIDLSSNPSLQVLSATSNNFTSLDFTNNPQLMDVYLVWNSGLTSLDFSHNYFLNYLNVSNCNLQYLNVANGNNASIPNQDFRCTGNWNLEYVCVDDTAYSNNYWYSYVDTHYVFVDTCSATPGGSTGIYNYNSDEISIRNNPTTDFVFLSEPCSYTLITMSGSVITQEVQSNIVDMHGLAPGLYILMINNKEGMPPKTYKLLRQ